MPANPPAREAANRWPSHSMVVSLVLATVFLPLLDDALSRSAPRAGAMEFRDQQVSAGSGESVAASPTPQPTPTPDAQPDVVLAVGDLVDCPDPLSLVAELAEGLPGPILALGDVVHPSGTEAEYRDCFDAAWGAVKERIRPVPGNHDYQTLGARPYYEYFGPAAGSPLQGYYSFDVGWWHIVALNSVCGAVGGCQADSAQIDWLMNDLEEHPATCTLAYFHHPRFSSGDGATPPRTEQLWATLYSAGVDVVLNGHDHNYERFAPQAPDGTFDEVRGIRQFVVGTGGANLTRRQVTAANSEVWTREAHGLLQLTLHRDRYDWQFVSAIDGQVLDSGSDDCH